mgnify:CR=1 FL=1
MRFVIVSQNLKIPVFIRNDRQGGVGVKGDALHRRAGDDAFERADGNGVGGQQNMLAVILFCDAAGGVKHSFFDFVHGLSARTAHVVYVCFPKTVFIGVFFRDMLYKIRVIGAVTAFGHVALIPHDLLERQGKTLSDVLRSGIVCEATRSGVMKNGVVAEKFRARISAYRQVLEAEAQTKRSTEK